jgi:hypothetical protein
MIKGPYYAKTETNTTERGVTMPEVELKPTENSGVIDVINEFMWTASPQIDKFSKVPVLYLTERKQTLNSLLASAIYYINAAGQGTANVLTKLTSFLPDAAENFLTGLGTWRTFADKFTGSGSDQELLKGLPAYLGIYQTELTGFNYALPYFNDDSGLNINNTWSDTAQTGVPIITDRIEGVGELADNVSSTLNIFQPGTFIEKPKYFQYDTSGRTITVTFPLFNTVSRGRGVSSTDKLPYQQNYEFLWILAYQNRPLRKSFSAVAPGKLYTLTIPGMEFFPYCFIESLKIDFKGTRRILPVILPDGNEVFTSIPEAYSVQIQIRSLLANVSNMMLQEQSNKITVSVR